MLRVKIAKFLLYLTAITPLIFSGNFYFPYIVPRTFFFRLIIELVFLIFIWLWAEGKLQLSAIRPWYKNYFVLSLGLIMLANLVASIFGLSFSSSMFGDIERSWGFYTLIHLYVFYLMLRVFFDAHSWKIYLNCLLAGVLGVAVYGIVQYYPGVFHINLFQSGPSRILSTLGNPAYTAMTLIFGMAIGIYLLIRTKYKHEYYIYGSVLGVLFFAFTLTGIRGAYLGFIIGLFATVFLLLFISTNRLIKRVTIGLLLFLLIGIILFFLFRDRPIFLKIPIVSQLTSIDLTSGTIKTRLISWRAVMKGFKDNPILGVGLENYGVVFNKYFDPLYYSLASSEPYFDRAHNSFLDILATTGLVGSIAFLILIIYLFIYLWRGWRHGYLVHSELAVFFGLFIAYFVHIFFVFDDLNSLLFFFVWLALLEYGYQKEPLFKIETSSKKLSRLFIAGTVGIFVVWLGLILNIRIARASMAVIDGMLATDGNQVVKNFRNALVVESIPRLGLSTSYIDWLVKLANDYKKVPTPVSKQVFDENFVFIKKILEEELNKSKYNPIIFLKLATIYSAHFLIYNNQADKDFALAYIDGAIALSPDRPQYYNLLAETYVIFGEPDKALSAVEKSLDLNSDYMQTYVYLVRSYAAAGQLDKSLFYFKESLKFGLITNMEDAAWDLANKFIKNNQNEQAIEIFNSILLIQPNNVKSLVNLTVIYLRENKPDQAIKYIEQAVKSDNNLKAEGNYIIQQIRAGKTKEVLTRLGA